MSKLSEMGFPVCQVMQGAWCTNAGVSCWNLGSMLIVTMSDPPDTPFVSRLKTQLLTDHLLHSFDILLNDLEARVRLAC